MSELESNVPFQHKHSYIRDERLTVDDELNVINVLNRADTLYCVCYISREA